MKRLKPYLPILYKLIVDLVLLGYDVIRQLILPNRRQAVAPWITTSWVYSKRYLRQGMIIATWAPVTRKTPYLMKYMPRWKAG